MVVEHCVMCYRKLSDFDKLFQRIGAVCLYERLGILREEIEGRSRV